MSFLKYCSIIFSLILFSQCASSNTNSMQTTPKLETKAPFSTKGITYQYWTSGVKGGGQGIHFHIPKPAAQLNITLDSVYFRGHVAKIQEGTPCYAGFKLEGNTNDVIMTNTPKGEYGNTLPKAAHIPFKLTQEECVISYFENNTKKYVKVGDLTKKPRAEYPSAPPRQ